MVRLNARLNKSDQGFTLLEILIALVIAGVLAATNVPSLLGILKGNEVKSAQDQLQGALRDAQRQAIRRSKACTITINTASNPVRITPKTTVDNDCLSTSNRELPKGVIVTLNGTGSDIKYSFKGHTVAPARTITFFSDKTGQKRCLVISAHLGIMRGGVYTGNPTSSVTADKCDTSTSNL